MSRRAAPVSICALIGCCKSVLEGGGERRGRFQKQPMGSGASCLAISFVAAQNDGGLLELDHVVALASCLRGCLCWRERAQLDQLAGLEPADSVAGGLRPPLSHRGCEMGPEACGSPRRVFRPAHRCQRPGHDCGLRRRETDTCMHGPPPHTSLAPDLPPPYPPNSPDAQVS